MPLPVPIEAAVNKEEVAAYEAKKAEAEAKGERLSGEEKVSCGFTIRVLKSILLHISHNRSDLKYLQRQFLKRLRPKLRLMTSTPPPSKRKPLERSL